MYVLNAILLPERGVHGFEETAAIRYYSHYRHICTDFR